MAILAFLYQTQDFFTKQRLIWALIVIAFGMSPTSGAGLFSFAGRIFATVVALVLSLIVWYIVDGHIAGVILFLYIANVFEVSCTLTQFFLNSLYPSLTLLVLLLRQISETHRAVRYWNCNIERHCGLRTAGMFLHQLFAVDEWF